jgi:hypothetical protein
MAAQITVRRQQAFMTSPLRGGTTGYTQLWSFISEAGAAINTGFSVYA